MREEDLERFLRKQRLRMRSKSAPADLQKCRVKLHIIELVNFREVVEFYQCSLKWGGQLPSNDRNECTLMDDITPSCIKSNVAVMLDKPKIQL